MDGFDCYLVFVSHRKISNGEAVVNKVRDGYWTGTLVKADGIPAVFELYR